MEPKYPQVVVPAWVTGEPEYSVIRTVMRALKKGGAPAEDLKRFLDEVFSGNRQDVIPTVKRWVTIEETEAVTEVRT